MPSQMDAAVANTAPRFPFASLCQRLLTPVLQIAAIIGLWWIADTIVRCFNLPIPGGVAGLFLLWGLLGTGILPVRWIRGGAKHLLDHLLLFFVPPMLALINHPELLGWIGLKLLLAILIGVPLVMTGTALIVEIGFRWSARHES